MLHMITIWGRQYSADFYTSFYKIKQMCNFIPKKILKNIAENDPNPNRKTAYKNIIADQKEEDFRKKRKRISQNLLKGVEPSVDRAHTESLYIYDNRSLWDYSKEKLWEEFVQQHEHNPTQKPRRVFTRDMDKVYDMFHDLLGRESFDNKNAVVNAFLKYGVNYPNAYWDGEVLAFGAGDHYYFNDFSKVFDVVGHEYGHAVTQYESNLQYEMQSGALNEHVSDVFGVCAYQRKYNLSVDKTDWIIGKGLFTKKVNGIGLRSFKDEVAYDDPVIGKDTQPKYMKDFIVAPNDEEHDWGEVHSNSGIPNHAFYLFNQKLGGKTWLNDSLKIWYYSILKQYNLSANATFEEFANKTIEIADMLNNTVTSKLAKSWEEVGVF
jgi:Zn-dependent metalloprotease